MMLPPAIMSFYAVVQNYEEYEGGGLAVIYASFTAKFFPEGTIATNEPDSFPGLTIAPNPAADYILVSCPEFEQKEFSWSLCDAKGSMWHPQHALNFPDGSGQISWILPGLPVGIYCAEIQQRIRHGDSTIYSELNPNFLSSFLGVFGSS